MTRKTDNAQHLLDGLRDAYIAYKESASRCKIEMKPRSLPGLVSELGVPPAQKAAAQEFQNFYVAP